MPLPRPEQVDVPAPRQPRASAQVAARIREELDALPEREQTLNVARLNPGAFLLERIRAQSVARRKSHVSVKVKGK